MDAASTPVAEARVRSRKLAVWGTAVAVPLAVFAILLWRPAGMYSNLRR